MIYHMSDEYVEILMSLLKRIVPQTATSFHLICLHWALVHVKVPHLGGEVVSGQQVASAVAELDVRHGGNDL